MSEFLNFSIIFLPTSKFLFSYQNPSFTENIDFKSIILGFLPLVQSSIETTFILNPTVSHKCLCIKDYTQTLFVLFVKEQTQQHWRFLQRIIEEYKKIDPLMKGISFEAKRFFIEKLTQAQINQENDKFVEVQREIENINDKMKGNIEKITIQQENILKLEKKTEILKEMGEKFNKDARQYHVQEVGKSKCFGILMGALVVIIFLVLIVIIAFYSDNTEDQTEITESNFNVASILNTTSLNH